MIISTQRRELQRHTQTLALSPRASVHVKQTIPTLAMRTNPAATELIAPNLDTVALERSLVEQIASPLTMFAGVIAMLMLSAAVIRIPLIRNVS